MARAGCTENGRERQHKCRRQSGANVTFSTLDIGRAKADQDSIVIGVSFRYHKNLWKVSREITVKKRNVVLFDEMFAEKCAAERRMFDLCQEHDIKFGVKVGRLLYYGDEAARHAGMRPAEQTYKKALARGEAFMLTFPGIEQATMDQNEKRGYGRVVDTAGKRPGADVAEDTVSHVYKTYETAKIAAIRTRWHKKRSTMNKHGTRSSPSSVISHLEERQIITKETAVKLMNFSNSCGPAYSGEYNADMCIWNLSSLD